MRATAWKKPQQSWLHSLKLFFNGVIFLLLHIHWTVSKQADVRMSTRQPRRVWIQIEELESMISFAAEVESKRTLTVSLLL